MESRLLTDEIYEALLEKITSKEWKIGDKILSENKICEIYHISRISARSVIQKLQAQNLITTKPGKGSFVVSNHIGENMITLTNERMDLSKDEYRYVMELRRAIEFTSVELMCQHGTEEDFEYLKAALDEMEASGSDVERYVEGDFKFHMAIIKGAHNPLFETVIRGCKSEFIKYFHEMAEASQGNFQKAIRNHTLIYEAMKTKDAETVKQIILGTFEYNLSRFKDMFREG